MSLLVRCFIKKPDDIENPSVRYAYGRLAGFASLMANLILFIIKLLAGVLSQSLAIMADAFNNLSDAGSSIVTLVGFKLSSAPPDKEHPFGHGRMEYLSALAVAAFIMIAGFELAVQSVEKIFQPTKTTVGIVAILILAAAIAIKLWMAFFNRRIGKKIHSQTLYAAAADSRNDVLCTAVVLVSSVISWQTGIAIDGYVGVLVALFVVWSGFSIVKNTVSPLLGQAPDPETVKAIRETVLAHDGVVGVHDLMVHNYGPGHLVISLHAEVPCWEDMMRSHDRIDLIEKEIMRKFHAQVCIHMDPIDTEDERIATYRALVQTILEDINPELTMHDFRVVFGETHTNLIFDLVVPFQFTGVSKLREEVQRRVQVVDERLFVVATVEHSFS